MQVQGRAQRVPLTLNTCHDDNYYTSPCRPGHHTLTTALTALRALPLVCSARDRSYVIDIVVQTTQLVFLDDYCGTLYAADNLGTTARAAGGLYLCVQPSAHALGGVRPDLASALLTAPPRRDSYSAFAHCCARESRPLLCPPFADDSGATRSGCLLIKLRGTQSPYA